MTNANPEHRIPLFIYTLPVSSYAVSGAGAVVFAIGVKTAAIYTMLGGAFMFIIFLAISLMARRIKRLFIDAS